MNALYCCPEYNAQGVEIPPPGWLEAPVVYSHHDGTQMERLERIDLATGDRYADDSMRVVAFKCACILVGLPFFTAGYILFHTVRAVVLVSGMLTRSIHDCIRMGTTSSLLNRAKKLAYEIPATVIESVWKSCTAPFYAVAMMGAAACGLVSPHTGRLYVAEVERAWRELGPRADILRHVPQGELFSALDDVFINRNTSYTFYLAHCFQPYGNVKDPHVISVNRMPVRKFLELSNL